VPRGETDRREWEKYVPEKFEGAPITLQLTGKDEETMMAAKVVAKTV